MGMWSKACRTHVAHMQHGDFYASELSTIMKEATDVSIEFIDAATGEVTVMKESTPLEKGEVIDASFMSVKALTAFFEEEINEAKQSDILLSLVSSEKRHCLEALVELASHTLTPFLARSNNNNKHST